MKTAFYKILIRLILADRIHDRLKDLNAQNPACRINNKIATQRDVTYHATFYLICGLFFISEVLHL